MQRKYEQNAAMKIEKIEYVPPTPEPESEDGKPIRKQRINYVFNIKLKAFFFREKRIYFNSANQKNRGDFHKARWRSCRSSRIQVG